MLTFTSGSRAQKKILKLGRKFAAMKIGEMMFKCSGQKEKEEEN